MKTLAKPAFLALPAAFAMLIGAAPATAKERTQVRVTKGAALALASSLNRLPEPQARFDAPSPTAARIGVAEDFNFGIGLFSVTGHFVKESGARGREPILGTSGRENRVAAVGLSFSF